MEYPPLKKGEKKEYVHNGTYLALVIRHDKYEVTELFETKDCLQEDALKIAEHTLKSGNGRIGKKVKIKFVTRHCVFPWYHYLIVGRPCEKEIEVRFKPVKKL